MDRVFFALGALLGAIGVVAGAFGAHALRGRVGPEMLAVFETGVRYHLVHALALLAVGWAAARWPGAAVAGAGWLFLAGVLVFSGSLYLLVLMGIRGLGAVTPFGGAALIAGWILLGWAAWRG
jgi:uncharacterized membrane protein YgdD (TMEM256/DUF423 family)